MMAVLLAASLFLHPVLDEGGPVRLVATGADVTWNLDGVDVAATRDREPATVWMDAGEHDVWVRTGDGGPWRALVRPEPDGGTGAVYVPAWTASHPGSVPASSLPPWAPWSAAAVGLGLLAWPRRRPKHP